MFHFDSALNTYPNIKTPRNARKLTPDSHTGQGREKRKETYGESPRERWEAQNIPEALGCGNGPEKNWAWSLLQPEFLDHPNLGPDWSYSPSVLHTVIPET